MQKVFFNSNGQITTVKTEKTVIEAEMNFYQRPQFNYGFDEEIEAINEEDFTVEELKDRNREWAHKASLSPYNAKSNITYFENVKEA